MLSRALFALAIFVGLAPVILLSSEAAPLVSLPATPLVVSPIDEHQRTTLPGHVHADVFAGNDEGAVSDALQIHGLQLVLRRSADREAALEQMIREQQEPSSPNYHRWLTPEEFGDGYGLALSDLSAVEDWLENSGFRVEKIFPSKIGVLFSGSAGLIRQHFGTEIHRIQLAGVEHYGNMSDPTVPVALSAVIQAIHGLHDFKPRPLVRLRPRTEPEFNSDGGQHDLSPADMAVIYNTKPLLQSGYAGQGRTIVLLGFGELVHPNDWSDFRSMFGLAGYNTGSFTETHPDGCTNPGFLSGEDEDESTLDIEMATAIAPGAAIQLASCGDRDTLTAIVNSSGPMPDVVSYSAGVSEPESSENNALVSSTYQQAAAEGISVFVSTGDNGADATEGGGTHPVATAGLSVNALASTPYNVAVGGTEFSDRYTGASGYWATSNNSAGESALSYVPEMPWNETCGNAYVAALAGFATTYGSSGYCQSGLRNNGAGGGGPSTCATGTPSVVGVVGGTCAGWPKPSWQSGVVGIPNDGVRDLPDVAMPAFNVVICESKYVTPSCDSPSTGAVLASGGTSAAAPIMAGVQALVNQYASGRQGNPNTIYYQLAATEFGPSGNPNCNSSLGRSVASTCVFYDITVGDTDVPCTPGTYNCFAPSGRYGVLSSSTSSYLPTYKATTGWDFATGLGSVNAFNLAKAWPQQVNLAVGNVYQNSGSTAGQGQTITFLLNVTNVGTLSTSGPITVTVTTSPSQYFSIYQLTANSGWTCGQSTCSRSGSLSNFQTTETIYAFATVAPNAPPGTVVTLSAQASVGATTFGSTAASATVGASPALSLSKQHSGNFWLGEQGAQYTLLVKNIGGLSTSGPITVSDALPAGVSLASAGGVNWTCTAQPVCTYSASLPSGGQSSPLTIAVNVANNAPASVTNIATASGGGAYNQSSASDPTSIVTAPNLMIAMSHSGEFAPGENGASYSIQVQSNGGAPASGTTVVTFTPPSQGTIQAASISATNPIWTCSQPNICSTNSPLPPGSSYSFVETVNVPTNATLGTYTSTANVSNPNDAIPSDNTATDSTLIAPSADASVQVNGGTSTFSVRASNLSSAAVAQSAVLTVTATMSAGVTAATSDPSCSVTAQSGGGTVSGQPTGLTVTYQCTIGDIAPNGSVNKSWTLAVTHFAFGSAQITASISTTSYDPNSANNTASGSASVGNDGN